MVKSESQTFEGQVALVTGASRGIGRATALMLAARGADVAVHYHLAADQAAEVVAAVAGLGRRAIAIQADLGAPALPDGFMGAITAALGPVDLLAHAAGVYAEDLATWMDVEEFDRVIAVNLRGALLACQAVLPGMLKARRGAIALVGSEAGRWGSPGLAAYAASKAGLAGFARSLAQEAGPRGVRVNVVSPGLIDTDMVAELPAERRAAILAHTALGRFGTGEDVARVVAFALGPDAAFVSGAVLPVDGGLRVL